MLNIHAHRPDLRYNLARAPARCPNPDGSRRDMHMIDIVRLAQSKAAGNMLLSRGRQPLASSLYKWRARESSSTPARELRRRGKGRGRRGRGTEEEKRERSREGHDLEGGPTCFIFVKDCCCRSQTSCTQAQIHIILIARPPTSSVTHCWRLRQMPSNTTHLP